MQFLPLCREGGAKPRREDRGRRANRARPASAMLRFSDRTKRTAATDTETQFFLSRPRRFGKSLMLSTLQAMRRRGPWRQGARGKRRAPARDEPRAGAQCRVGRAGQNRKLAIGSTSKTSEPER